jgi:hypothetical protein
MVKKLGLAILLLIATAIPAAAQVNDTYIIPAAANTGGNFNTRWMTQLSLFNPQLDYALKVSITYLPSEGGKALEVLVNVPANTVVFADNALLELFNISGSGGLVVATFPEDNPGVPNDVISRSFLVTSNTFNNSSSGTFGQTIPGLWTGLQDYATDGISAVSHGVRNIARFFWRTNFGAVNLGSSAVTLRVNVYDAKGNTIVKNATYTVPAQAHIQRALPVEVDHGSVEFFVDDATKRSVVFPYTSQIDQYSGDPTYQTPLLLASAKILYGKKAMPAATAIGKKIGLDEARVARASAMSLGVVEMRSE